MSIPKDPSFIDEETNDNSVIATTDPKLNPSNIQDSSELQDDGTEYRPTEEFPDGQVQLASLNNLYRKGSKVVSDVASGVNEFLTKETTKDTTANVNKPKNVKAGEIQGDDLAVTDTDGSVFIRPLKAEEVEEEVVPQEDEGDEEDGGFRFFRTSDDPEAYGTLNEVFNESSNILDSTRFQLRSRYEKTKSIFGVNDIVVPPIFESLKYYDAMNKYSI